MQKEIHPDLEHEDCNEFSYQEPSSLANHVYDVQVMVTSWEIFLLDSDRSGWVFGSPEPFGSLLRCLLIFGFEKTWTDRSMLVNVTESSVPGTIGSVACSGPNRVWCMELPTWIGGVAIKIWGTGLGLSTRIVLMLAPLEAFYCLPYKQTWVPPKKHERDK